MSINSHNYTNRKRIYREDLNINQKNEDLTFNANPQLQTYDFPGEAEIMIEVWVPKAKNTLLRIDWGTVASPGLIGDASLANISYANQFKCNFKVVNPYDKLLLGLAEEVEFTAGSVEENPTEEKLLDVIPTDSLGGRIWDLCFHDENAEPFLYIDESMKHLGTDLFFLMNTAPIILKLVLQKMTEICDQAPDEDSDSEPTEAWIYKWYKFVQESCKSPIDYPNIDDMSSQEDWPDACNKWIDSVVKSYGLNKLAPHIKTVRGIEIEYKNIDL